jgi:hypothetical protein
MDADLAGDILGALVASMNEELTAQVVAAAIGVVTTILWRLIDRYLPDPTGEHPLPPRPGTPDPPKA